MKITKKFTPYDVISDIYKIDYNKLYEDGRKIILFDLDNTIISYEEDTPDPKAIKLFNKIKEIGFKIYLISNNKIHRVSKSATNLGVYFCASAKKPFKSGYKKLFKTHNIENKDEVIAVGDQVLTDVYGGNRVGIDVILCNAIKPKTEKWYTKLNRNLENVIIKKFKKDNPIIYQKIISARAVHE